MFMNHDGPGNSMHGFSELSADWIIDGLLKGHEGLLPLYVATQEEVDYLQGLGLMKGVDVEVYVWGSNPWTDPTLNNFYTYLEGVLP